MARATITNTFIRLEGIPFQLLKTLDVLTNYVVEGHEHSKAFRSHYWDGREHLMKRTRDGAHLVPTGLLPDIESILTPHCEIVDERKKPGPKMDIKWVGRPSRGYQSETVDKALKDRGLSTGRGLINLPIRTGKTHVAGRIISQLGHRALFIVPSDMLLYQTKEAFERDMEPAPVGLFGDGRWEPDWITVATVQSMLSRPKVARELMACVDVLIIDEAHHLEAPAWRVPALRCDARWKFGLSATIKVVRDQPSELSSIWLKAVTGPILARVSIARMIREGFLLRPSVLFYRMEPSQGETWSYQRAYKELVERSEQRNGAIADLAEDAVLNGLRVMVDTGRIYQMHRVCDMLRARGVVVELLHGKIPALRRMEVIKRLQANETQAVVGTVLGEGIDIPELEVVINAEGQKSRTAAIQRMRNLTPCEGKTQAIFVDFADMTNKHLRKHSLARLRTYRGIRGFRVRIVENDGTRKFRLPSELFSR